MDRDQSRGAGGTVDLASRLRERLKSGQPDGPSRPAGAPADRGQSERELAGRLGGRLIETEHGSCLVIERTYGLNARHGSWAVAPEALEDREAMAVLVGDPALDVGHPRESPGLMFFDLETTGLSGGAGTYAFLVGCGFFEAGGFRVRQFFLTRPSVERALLSAVACCLASAGGLVTFNGKTFDIPVIENRWLLHRMAVACDRKPHLDMLHPARRLWRRRSHDRMAGVRNLMERQDRRGATRGWDVPGFPASGSDPSALGSCSLGSLERALLGVHRHGDPDGFEIPALYGDFLRTGETGRLGAVFEHNRLDLLSLAGLASRALWLVGQGPAAARDAQECLGLGRLYERAGRRHQAMQCFVRAASVEAPASSWHEETARRDALRWLARGLRRARRHGEAAATWQHLLDLVEPGVSVEREAAEALAIHHEHRTRDLTLARRYALRALAAQRSPVRSGLSHRLARLERKLDREPSGESGPLLG